MARGDGRRVLNDAQTIEMTDELDDLVGERVVLDTGSPTIYLGILDKVTVTGFWLSEADVHDCRDGHASPEVYTLAAATDGITPNRKRVFVLRSAVMSVSRLTEVIADFTPTEGDAQ